MPGLLDPVRHQTEKRGANSLPAPSLTRAVPIHTVPLGDELLHLNCPIAGKRITEPQRDGGYFACLAAAAAKRIDRSPH